MVSGNFTAWSDLLPGEIVCRYCTTLFKDQRFRRQSWVLTSEELTFLDRRGALERILSPPDPPFVIYVRFAGKRQDFLKAVRWPNGSGERFMVAVEGYGMIPVVRSVALEYADLISRALEAGLRKGDLLRGCSSRAWRAAEDLCRRIEEVRGDPLWEVLVRLS